MKNETFPGIGGEETIAELIVDPSSLAFVQTWILIEREALTLPLFGYVWLIAKGPVLNVDEVGTDGSPFEERSAELMTKVYVVS